MLRATMQLDRQPRSGLATVKRDFSSNNTTHIPPASHPPVAATKRSTLSDTLRKAIQDGVASREAEKASLTSSSLTSSQKRSLSPGAVPLRKKRHLPSSWGDCEPSSVTFPKKSSPSSVLLTRTLLRMAPCHSIYCPNTIRRRSNLLQTLPTSQSLSDDLPRYL
jgi:hypothetical protein